MGALTSLIASGVATVASHRQGKKATKASQAANEAQRKANKLRNKQAKRAFLRKFRQSQANIVVSSVAAGVGLESSAFQGSLSSEVSQRDTALREFKEADELGAEFTAQQNRATSASFRSQAFGAIGNFASQFISFAGGFGDKEPKEEG